MANLNDLDDVTISNPKVGDVVKYTAQGWENGADATGSASGGNPCGDLDGILYEDSAATLTQPWLWQGPDGKAMITVESPTEKSEITGGSFEIYRKDSGEFGKLAIEPDSDVILRASKRLIFKDNQISAPVSLAELVANSSSGNGGSGFAPLIHDFNIDLNAGNSQASSVYQWSSPTDTGKGLNVAYPIQWATKVIDGAVNEGSIKDVMLTEQKAIAMPTTADAALVFFQGSVQHRSAVIDNPSNASAHTAHRMKLISGATFAELTPGVSRISYFGTAIKNIIFCNNPAAVDERIQQSSWCKADMIEFAPGATVVFQGAMDVQKGGRIDITVRSGRIIILPFSKQGNTIATSLTGYGFDADLRGAEEDLQDALDADSPPLTAGEESVIELGSDLRNLMRRVISSLDSRKLHPPVGSSKTQTDYETQVGLLWAILDSSVLLTYDATLAALQPIIDEVSSPEYGIADLFEYEKQSGATSLAKGTFL